MIDKAGERRFSQLRKNDKTSLDGHFFNSILTSIKYIIIFKYSGLAAEYWRVSPDCAVWRFWAGGS